MFSRLPKFDHIAIVNDVTPSRGLDESYFVLYFPTCGQLGSLCLLLLQREPGMNVLVHIYGLVLRKQVHFLDLFLKVKILANR